MFIENGSVEVVETTNDREVAAPEEVTETTQEVQSENYSEEQPETEPEIPHKVWETARKRAENEAMRRVNAQFAQRFGSFTNPTTGKPVQTMDDYFAALDAQQQARTEQQLREKGIDPEMLNQAVQQNPVVQQAQQILARQQQDAAQRELQEQLAEIGKIDPSIKSMADLVKIGEFAKFDAYVRSGMKMDDAYKAACFDRLTQQRADASKQAAINAAKGKQHLSPTDGSAEVESEIPAGELSKWKAWFPEKSAAQLNALYKRVHKGE